MTRVMVEIPGKSGIYRAGEVEGDDLRLGSRVSTQFKGEEEKEFLVLWIEILFDEDMGKEVQAVSVVPIPPRESTRNIALLPG